MATAADLPCDGDGVCMLCKAKPEESESLICNLCATPWHVPCLSKPPETMSSAVTWECPDCSDSTFTSTVNVVALSGISADLIVSIRAIEMDKSLSDKEKARKRQNLLGGNMKADADEEDDKQVKEEEISERGKKRKTDMLELFDAKFNCSFCMQLPERPVTVSFFPIFPLFSVINLRIYFIYILHFVCLDFRFFVILTSSILSHLLWFCRHPVVIISV